MSESLKEIKTFVFKNENYLMYSHTQGHFAFFCWILESNFCEFNRTLLSPYMIIVMILIYLKSFQMNFNNNSNSYQEIRALNNKTCTIVPNVFQGYQLI